MFYLEEKQLPFQIHDRKVKAGKKQDYFPLLRLYVDNVEVELMIFPDDGHGSLSALNSMTGKGVKRADYKRLQEILAAMPPP